MTRGPTKARAGHLWGPNYPAKGGDSWPPEVAAITGVIGSLGPFVEACSVTGAQS